MKSDKNKSAVFAAFYAAREGVVKYVSENSRQLLILTATFFVCAVCAFVRIALTTTVSSYNIGEYEVGQVADVTIVATRSLRPEFGDQVSVEKGEKVTRKGFAITEEQYAKLKKMAADPAYIDYRAFCNSAVYLLLMMVLFLFLFSRIYFGSQPEVPELLAESTFLVLVYVVTVFASRAARFSSPFFLVSVIPASFCVLMVAILYGQLNAVFFSVVVALAVFNACGYAAMPLVYVLATSLVSSRIVLNVTNRNGLVFVALGQAGCNVIFMALLSVVFGGRSEEVPFAILGAAVNGFLSGIMCNGFLTPAELLLNTASVFRLNDLSDTNTSALKRLNEVAGGTYTHSMNVARLAENACNKIGANPLLARVAAYYHDIGKMDNPDFFTENQRAGEKNIHDDVKPSMSVTIIRNHVKKSVEKAEELRLPKAVVTMIGEHHGNQVIRPSFEAAKKLDPNANPADYSYQASPPSTKESGVLMLADTVEAACRSLSDPSYSYLDEFISKLIASKLDANQLDNCAFTRRDLALLHDSFLETQAKVFHKRIRYPGQKDEKAEAPAPAASAKEPPELAAAKEKAAPEPSDEKDRTAENVDKLGKPEKAEKVPKAEKAPKDEREEKPAKAEKPAKEEKTADDRDEKPAKAARGDKEDKKDAKEDKPVKSEKPVKAEKKQEKANGK